MKKLVIGLVAVAFVLVAAAGAATFRVYIIPDFNDDLWATIRTVGSIIFGGALYVGVIHFWRNGP